MSERSRGSATYDDVLSAPEDKVAEIVGGDLYLSPRPASRHARATSVLLGTLSPAFDFRHQGSGRLVALLQSLDRRYVARREW